MFDQQLTFDGRSEDIARPTRQDRLFMAPTTMKGQTAMTVRSNVSLSRDLLGPRWTFQYVDDAEERCAYELYAGDWTCLYESMGEDCCWRENRFNARLGEVLAIAVGHSRPFTVDEVVTAHMGWAQVIGGRKGAGMMRSLNVQLAKLGLQIAG